MSQDQDAIIIIDMNKFPEEIREKLPKDLQEKLIELLQAEQSDKNKQNTKPSGLYTIQQGYVVGNVYKDGILPKEPQSSQQSIKK